MKRIKNFYIASSLGHGTTELNSFDDSLLNSGIANYNLVKVSSILPAFAIKTSDITIPEGSILYTAYATHSTYDLGVNISAAIAVGIPSDPKKTGVIMEFSGNCSSEEAKQNASKMVMEAMSKRGYVIKEILCEAAQAIGDGKQFITVFAALAMW